MQIKGNSGYNPVLFSQAQKSRASFAETQSTRPATDPSVAAAGADQGSAPVMMASNAPPIVDVNTILENWGTSNAIADLNVDGIVDAQDLSMVLNAAQETPSGGGDDSPEDAWTALTGGDLNGDGVVDAMDLAV